ncbi:MAG TPA: molybdate ABC transporter substrate-binding protein [Ilumatobacteraceae bacterium]|nr:molybdate ABC transporter substrate-binding protein [Ilumatobacteraceae bacterium]
MRSRRALASATVIACFVLAGCGRDSGRSDQITIFAPSSLTEVFAAMGDAYARDNPDADPNFTFASSSDLARQIIEGAPADVFASADLANMTKVTDAGVTDADPVVFATNRAEIIVAPGNPLGLAGVEDLASDDLVVVVCAPEVPCGTYADEVFDNSGVEVTPDSLEENVKAVVTKVTLGEADAGIVYVTDVIAAGPAATGVAIPDDINVVAEYPIVTIGDAGPAAQDFVDFVLRPKGQAILEGFGFGAP